MAKTETVIVLSAHSDDFVLGAGGTIASYTAAGKKVLAIIFSYGEKSHPWMKSRVIKTLRKRETMEACTVLKCQAVFFDLKEGSYLTGYREGKVEQQFLRILERRKPVKLFTHSSEDPHPDHRAVQQITLQAYEKLRYKPKPEVYSYSVWNPVSLKTKFPSLYVDVSGTFSRKMAALKRFESQKLHITYPVFVLLYHAVKDGIRIGGKFGEHFFRIR